jgi:hypothetical protein
MSRHMRTTVRLDDALLERARKEAHRRGITPHGADRGGFEARHAPAARVGDARAGSAAGASRTRRYSARCRPRQQCGAPRSDGATSVILPDVNVLISAYRRDSVDHARYKRWLEDVVNGRSAYGMSPQVVGSLVRVCTHPQVFAVPDCCEDVLGSGGRCSSSRTRPSSRQERATGPSSRESLTSGGGGCDFTERWW